MNHGQVMWDRWRLWSSRWQTWRGKDSRKLLHCAAQQSTCKGRCKATALICRPSWMPSRCLFLLLPPPAVFCCCLLLLPFRCLILLPLPAASPFRLSLLPFTCLSGCSLPVACLHNQYGKSSQSSRGCLRCTHQAYKHAYPASACAAMQLSWPTGISSIRQHLAQIHPQLLTVKALLTNCLTGRKLTYSLHCG